MALAVVLTLGFVSCKPKDADIKKNVETALSASPDAGGISVAVDKAVVTLSGEVKDENTKSIAGTTAKGVKGVESVVNNTTVAAPPVVVAPEPASVTTELDAATQQKVKDGLKDIKGVTVEFSADKAVLKGEVSKADRLKIMQMLASAKVVSDVSGLTDKK